MTHNHLLEGLELLDVVLDGRARVAIYQDFRDGVSHWFILEFRGDDATWESVVCSGDKKIRTAFDRFAKAKDMALSTPVSQDDDE